MCRWTAWSGQPVIVEELVFQPVYGLIDRNVASASEPAAGNGVPAQAMS